MVHDIFEFPVHIIYFLKARGIKVLDAVGVLLLLLSYMGGVGIGAMLARGLRNCKGSSCNGGQAMTARGWLQGALGAMDAGYGRRGKAVGKTVGERRG